MSDSDPQGPKGPLRARAFGLGGAIGVLGGLIGLGGAEFRLPVLHGLFAFPIHQAVRFNLLISLATVIVSLAARFAFASFPALGPLTGEILAVAAGAVAAAWFGTGLLGRLSERSLILLVSGLLAGIAALLLVEAVLPVGFSVGLPDVAPLRIATGIAAGVAIGMVSSLLGWPAAS
ncbi:TSUP family transporter [Skermanella pratensis]|uniref:TSUP family transporter n=1 Tax=Skermanella pratensis TaxID=2233999 RepID=UPI001301424D|nr:TSUP family transporter [Skermanella pratensis]